MSSTSLLHKPKASRAPKAAAKQPAPPGKPSATLPLPPSFHEQFIAELTRAWASKVARNKTVHLGRYAIPTKSGTLPAFEQLTEGTLELARVVLYHSAAETFDEPHADKTQDFRAAYSAILQSVPLNRRRTLLLCLREGLDQVSKTELEAAPEPAAGAGKNMAVSTADFMSAIEHHETDQRVRDVAEGSLIPAAAMAARLQISPQALHGALKAKRVFTLRGPSGTQCWRRPNTDPPCRSKNDPGRGAAFLSSSCG